MSVKRSIVALVCEVPEEYVKCSTCARFDNGICKGWNSPVENHQENYCTFWEDRKEKDGEAESREGSAVLG